jgi:hypothetical protein
MKALRLGLSFAGFVLAVLSITLDDRRLVWGAIALLTGSLLLRFLQRRRDKSGTGT